MYFKRKFSKIVIIIFTVCLFLMTNKIIPVFASSQTPIIEETEVTKEHIIQYYEKNSPVTYPYEYVAQGLELEKFVDIVILEAKAEGVRADIAFAQIILETNWFTFSQQADITKNNFGGLKDENGNYLSFQSIEEGIRANIQLLKGDASTESLNQEKIKQHLEQMVNTQIGVATEEQLEKNDSLEESNATSLLNTEIIKMEDNPSPEAIKQIEDVSTQKQISQNIPTNVAEQNITMNSVSQVIEAQPAEVKTLTIDGTGYAGVSHRIRSYGTSENGVLYQFWVKDLSENKWMMIQDYNKSSAQWIPTKPGKYLYGVHIKDEMSSERLDAHSYKEIIIKEIPAEVKTLSIEGPEYVGGSHRIRSYGTTTNGVVYQFWIKDLSENKWSMIQDYSKSSAVWTPTKSGKYLYGVHIKDKKSTEKLEAYLYKEITIEPAKVKTLSIDGPGYVGGSHKISSYGTSVNGVLYQFWVKDLSENKWSMIQDYSKSSATWIPENSGEYWYGVHIKDEGSNEKLDTHLYKRITIREAIINSLAIQNKGYVRDELKVNAGGLSANGVLYQFWIKDLGENKWSMIQDYSKSSSAVWTPTKPGKYLYGVHVKDEKSDKELDEYLYISIDIEYNIVDKALYSYKEQGIEYKTRLQDYNVIGDYLNYGKTVKYTESTKLIFDDNGIPKVKYGQDFYYNPVIISQYALTKYGQYINEKGEKHKLDFLAAVDTLIELQDETGAFRYDFSWKYYLTGETYKPGWVSGMAQGQALNALSRAYRLSNNPKYLKAGDKAVEFLITPTDQGGTMSTLENLDPSLKDYIFFEEYISTPNNYTLNGYMFTLLGLYDWKIITSEYRLEEENLAEEYFESGIKTLEIILPYYDIGGFSAYDLGHFNFNKEPHISERYHAVHIQLLHALDSVESNKELKEYEKLWRLYVDELE
ncbi:D-glucuronyl C5-epimerase family protein [Alkalibaculum bacchi]|nr:D-glucuronyl C5-epimerase family protein [Alkalibaculum bacchi]